MNTIMYCLSPNFGVRTKMWAATIYLSQDLHGKYLPRLWTLNLPHLENLKKRHLILILLIFLMSDII